MGIKYQETVELMDAKIGQLIRIHRGRQRELLNLLMAQVEVANALDFCKRVPPENISEELFEEWVRQMCDLTDRTFLYVFV